MNELDTLTFSLLLCKIHSSLPVDEFNTIPEVLLTMLQNCCYYTTLHLIIIC